MCLIDQHVTSKTPPSAGHRTRVAQVPLAGAPWSLSISAHRTCRRHAHVAYGLGNSDKGGGNISLGVVATGRDREYCII